jgi:hypothetical protein
VADLFSMASGSTIAMGDKNEGTYLTNASVAEVAGQMLPRYAQNRDGSLMKNLRWMK